MKIPFIYMASLLSFLLVGCGARNEKVLHQGTFNGQKYVVKSYETRDFNNKRVDWLLQMGDLPALPINVTMKFGAPVLPKSAITTDWGVPYSDEIFGQTERTYFGAPPAYSNEGDDYSKTRQVQHDETMLYVSPAIPADRYRQYASMMKSEWAKIDKALVVPANNGFPRIVGVAHSVRPFFIRHFRGTIGGVAHVLRIDPDGYVNLGVDDGSAESNAESNRVRHCKVQMPGKTILLRKIYGWNDYKTSKAEIAKFKDAQGKRVGDFFRLQS